MNCDKIKLSHKHRTGDYSPVLGVVRAGVVGPHDDEDVLELRANVGDEGKGTRFLDKANM